MCPTFFQWVVSPELHNHLRVVVGAVRGQLVLLLGQLLCLFTLLCFLFVQELLSPDLGVLRRAGDTWYG